MKKFEIWFRNQNVGTSSEEGQAWETMLSVLPIGEEQSSQSFLLKEEVNAQEQTWEAITTNINCAIAFAQFIAGVSDLNPDKEELYEQGEIRMHFTYIV
jgi:hypothetical protein